MKSIAIDGPSAAGKSTMAKMLAKQLGYIYVDTGALYRTVAYHCEKHGAKSDNSEAVCAVLDKASVELAYKNGVQKVLLNGEDVTEEIRKPWVSMAASNVSAIPKVRNFLFDLQQNIAKTNNVVMDGRDIGTVVLPSATVKIFLTASPEERATRRMEDFKLAGEEVDYQKLLEEIKQRDFNDSNREIAPLKKADDAIEVDTTGNTLEQSAQLLYNLVREKL